MSLKPAGQIRQAWYRWKALKLPWRKRFLVGLDLHGNTYWEFRDTISLSASSSRMRRIVNYAAGSTLHYSDVTSQISPAWHQWLRHTRSDPPSLTEQSQDVIRQENLKVLAAAADARWAAKPSYLDVPERQKGQPMPALAVKRLGANLGGEADTSSKSRIDGEVGTEDLQIREGNRQQVHGKSATQAERNASAETKEKIQKDDPWKKARGGPSEEWQPEAWNPNITATKR